MKLVKGLGVLIIIAMGAWAVNAADTVVVGSPASGTNEVADISINSLELNAGSAASPSLSWGDGDTGIYESSDDTLQFSFGGTSYWFMNQFQLFSVSNDGPILLYADPSATSPSIAPSRSDVDTGIGRAGADQFSLIAGATESARITTSGLEVKGGIRLPFYNMSSNYTVLATDYSIFGNVTSASATATLPTAASACTDNDCMVLNIKKIDGGSNTLTIVGNGGETIDDLAAFILSTQGESITVQANGSEWFIQ